MKNEDILKQIESVSHNIKWRDLEKYFKQNNYEVIQTKKGYKVNIKQSVWCLHLEHRISNELKHGIIRNLRKVLIKEKILKLDDCKIKSN